MTELGMAGFAARAPQRSGLAEAALLLGCALLAGCQGLSSGSPDAQVRFIDVSPDAPPLEIRQNATPVLYNLGFGAVSSYVPTTPGASLQAAFSSTTGRQLAALRASLAPGGQYTVVAADIAAALQLTVLPDQSTPAPAGHVAMRILDEATRAGAIDVYLTPPGMAPIALAPTLAGARFGTRTGYLQLPAGPYSLAIYPAGVPPTTGSGPLYLGPQMFYGATSAHTLIVVDQPLAQHAVEALATVDYDPTAL